MTNGNTEAALLDFIPLSEAKPLLGRSDSELVKAAIAGEMRLYHLAKQPEFIVFELAQRERIENDFAWLAILNYDDEQNSIRETVVANIGDRFELDSRCLRSLLINGSYSALDLFRGQLDAQSTLKNYPHTNHFTDELEWITNSDLQRLLNLSDTYVNASQVANDKIQTEKHTKADSGGQSNTALKVIGLLMHHLAKSPKYASGTKPNKSQIKELLIDLADELNVDPYGLNKVDERVLADAMKYLDNQKR